MASKIFISYRRDDAKYQAQKIFNALTGVLPRENVFIDVDSIPLGHNYVTVLETWVSQCDALLALITKDWVGSIHPKTHQKRLVDLNDPVRVEIREALRREIPVVPVLLDGASIPDADELPDDIRELNRRQASIVEYRTFDDDVARLIRKLQLNSDAESTKRSPITLDERKPATVAPSNPVLDRTLEHSYWVALEDSADFSDYAEFLERFPSGVYAPLARKRFEARIAKAQRGPIERFLHERPISSFATPLRARLASIEWADLGQDRSAAKLRAFIERHFDSVEAGQAKTELAKIEWNRLSQIEDVAEINRILPDLDNTPEADLARRRRDALKLEKEQWDAAVAANSVTSFQTFLTKFPKGKYSGDAKQRIRAAEIATKRQRQVELKTPSEPPKSKGPSWLFGVGGRGVAAVLLLVLAIATVFWLRSAPTITPSQESLQSLPPSSTNPQAGSNVQAPHDNNAATPPRPKISDHIGQTGQESPQPPPASITNPQAGNSVQATHDSNAATPSRPMIPDRGGQAGQAQSQPDQSKVQEAATPGHVVLYEEDPSDPNGKRYTGTVVWSLENVPAGPGQPMDKAIRGDISIPERNMTVTFTIRRNTDNPPAAHTVSINFTLPADFSHGGIQEIRGLLMKQSESTRGVTLAGLSVKVTTGFFLIGLSATEGDLQRNIQMLKERGWFDIAVVYNDNRRAVMAVEKGSSGDKVFNDAFAAWRQ
jgi:hypothetical protein